MEDAGVIVVVYRIGPKLQIPLPSPKGFVVVELELPGNRAGVPNSARSCSPRGGGWGGGGRQGPAKLRGRQGVCAFGSGLRGTGRQIFGKALTPHLGFAQRFERKPERPRPAPRARADQLSALRGARFPGTRLPPSPPHPRSGRSSGTFGREAREQPPGSPPAARVPAAPHSPTHSLASRAVARCQGRS